MTNSYSEIKVWNNLNMECLFKYRNESVSNIISSLFHDENNIYIIVIENLIFNIYDINTNNKIKSIIYNKYYYIYFIESFYDKKNFKNYFIISSDKGVISYDINKGKS